MQLSQLRISEKKQAVLSLMNIDCVEDLLTHYPYRYEQLEIHPVSEWEKDMKVSFQATIVSQARVIRYGGKRSVTRFKVMYDEHEFQISMFNRPWVSSFRIGSMITIIGKYEGGDRVTGLSYNFEPLSEQLGLTPVYTTREGITQKDIRKYMEKAFHILKDQLENFLPDDLILKYRLISRREAIQYIHFPGNKESVKQSLRHLKYEEFFKFQLAMQTIKIQETHIIHGHRKIFDMDRVMDLKKSLSFTLTHDQEEAILDILHDLQSEKVMYRMVQGDVGCGKTMVAAFGLYACVLSHKQAAFMAPTEILAKQHFKNLRMLLQDFDVRVDALYSSLNAKEKRAVMKRLKENEIDIIVGTHALFQERVEFHDLGMVVADEQHRFGVGQRRKLLEKGDKVDFLLMSATPIPRTLALSLYGDMDVSTIQELPKGRQPITTQLVQSSSMGPILPDVLRLLDEGNQCYVVCPAIEKNEEFQARNVTEIYEGMQASIGKKYRISLLHGKMNAQQKDEVMNAFIAHEIDILISTTVIEVGVDVKNANVMVIYDANRFGLSQIHQLRGRVGRGDQPGYCYLLTSSKDPDSLRRLQTCEQTCDGFEIARNDLLLRGPGDILGTRQSGVPGFILGDVIQDSNILEVARDDAAAVLKHLQDYPRLKQYIDEKIQSGTYLD